MPIRIPLALALRQRRARSAVISALSAAVRGHARMRRVVGSLLLVAFVFGCAEAFVGSACDQDGVGLVTSAHWTEGPSTPGSQPAAPSDVESRCHCSPLYGTTTAVADRTAPAVAVGTRAPVGHADRVPVGPEREPPLRPPATLLS